MSVLEFLKSLNAQFRRRKKRFRDQQGFDYTISIANGCAEMAAKYSRWHGTVMDSSIQRHKKSEVLFILGSGPSINLITDSEWEHIRKHDSVGFNWWMAHDFIPSFYLLQFANSEALFKLIQTRSPDYRHVPLILRGDSFANGSLPLGENPKFDFLKEHELYYLREYAISSRCAIDIHKLFQHVELLGMLTHGSIGTLVPKWRSTLGLLMSWGYQMGYNKMVLCGMDMHSNEHFWHDLKHKEMCHRYNLPGVESAKKKNKGYGIMAFTDEAISQNTVPRYVTELAHWMNERADVHTFVNSTQTILYPSLPAYSFECMNSIADNRL
jgi:hypothetical protein